MVGRYYGPQAADGPPGRPMPHPTALREGDTKHLLPGTFVPSARHASRGARSVRRAIFGPDGSLYVADRAAGSIKRFDAGTGTPDAGPFIDGLEDYLEFILLVGG